jgi:hypothetical protein
LRAQTNISCIPSKEIKTWVTSYDQGKVEWSQSSLFHAAISLFGSVCDSKAGSASTPRASSECTDKEGISLIHLAFWFCATDKQVLCSPFEPFPRL